MLADRRLDGLIQRLNARYPGHRQLAEDAACHAVVKILEQISSTEIRSVGAYLYQVADNHIRRTLGGVVPPLDIDDFDPKADEPPDALEGADLLRLLKNATALWNDNIRVVTNLVLDHTFLDDYDWMTAEDLADEASAILSEEVSAASASMWKSRGLTRLRELFV